jgi:UDP-N-acetylmuramoyl-tripeptide--D-alanyl-D-alanine ligase
MARDEIDTRFWQEVVKRGQRKPKLAAQAVAAKLMRRRLKDVRIVAITGSCGKSTASALTAHLLAPHGRLLAGLHHNKPEFIFSNIIGAERGIRYLVQEVSGHAPGIMAFNCAALRPFVGVVTKIGLDHYKTFRTMEAVADEKSNLVASLPEEGVAVLNADDPLVAAMARSTRARVLTYGEAAHADLRATEVSSSWPEGLSFTAHYKGETVAFRTQLFGIHWITSVLAALGAAVSLGIPLAACVEPLASFETLDGRCKRFHDECGIEFILDTKKFPSWTADTALDILRYASAPRRTMVIGSISDYGGKGERQYKKLLRKATEVADRVIVVGMHAGAARRLNEQVKDKTLLGFASPEEVRRYLTGDVIPGELVLVKGSLADNLNAVAPAYAEEPTRFRRYMPA